MKTLLPILCVLIVSAINAKAELQWWDYKSTRYNEETWGYQLRKSFAADSVFTCWHLTVPAKVAGVYRGVRLVAHDKPGQWPQNIDQVEVAHQADGSIEIVFFVYPNSGDAVLVLNTGIILGERECQPVGGFGGFKFRIPNSAEVP